MAGDWRDPAIGQTVHESERIWRYTSYARLIDLLERAALHLAPLSALDDPLEGHLPYQAARATAQGRSAALGLGKLGSMQLGTTVEQQRDRLRAAAQHRRETTFVSCWHANDVESDAMWRIYASQHLGIAIGTSVSALKSAVTIESDAWLGRVDYRRFDREREDLPGVGNAFRKRLAYRHDQELRLAIVRDPPPIDGLSLPVKLTTLVERVRVGPGTPPAVAESVSNWLQRYGLPAGLVEHSFMEKGPQY